MLQLFCTLNEQRFKLKQKKFYCQFSIVINMIIIIIIIIIIVISFILFFCKIIKIKFNKNNNSNNKIFQNNKT
jgi:hypothetical protein